MVCKNSNLNNCYKKNVCLYFQARTEMVVEEVENVAEVVEKVATVAEKVSSDVADKLPDNGKLKESALFVERVSKIAAQDAQITKDFIHKVIYILHVKI